jgi:hypothetical protein
LGLIHKIAKTHRYRLTPKGHLLTAALFASQGRDSQAAHWHRCIEASSQTSILGVVDQGESQGEDQTGYFTGIIRCSYGVPAHMIHGFPECASVP